MSGKGPLAYLTEISSFSYKLAYSIATPVKGFPKQILFIKTNRKLCYAITSIFVFLVQKPAPVRLINITKILTTSKYTRVDYKIKTKESESSCIINLIVYLNETEDQIISTRGMRKSFFLQINRNIRCFFDIYARTDSVNQWRWGKKKATDTCRIFFHHLKPNTKYTFGIKTQDGSLQNSTRVTGKFKTIEAGIMRYLAVAMFAIFFFCFTGLCSIMCMLLSFL